MVQPSQRSSALLSWAPVKAAAGCLFPGQNNAETYAGLNNILPFLGAKKSV
jgi:hypothetical protein